MAPLKGNAPPKGAVARSFRFSPLAARILDMLADEEERTNTGYLERLLKRQAEAKGWDLKQIAEEIEKQKQEQTNE